MPSTRIAGPPSAGSDVYREMVDAFVEEIVVYAKDRVEIKSSAQINQLKSIQNNYTCLHPYSECWIRFGESYALTVRLEASHPKYLAFQTQGEIRSELDRIYGENGHNMQKAIEQYIEQSK